MSNISVIIPVYKVEDTLRRCVDSVLAQTYTDYGVILVDDGSPDNSGEICDCYAALHENIAVIHQENAGVSAARNAGLERARGEYVMFLDSDDYLAENCLEILTQAKADLVIGSLYVITPTGEIREQSPRDDRMMALSELSEIMAALIEENRMNYLHAKLFRRSIISQHKLCFEDYLLTAAEDTVFVYNYLRYCESIYIIGQPLHYYTYNPSGLAHKNFLTRVSSGYRLRSFMTTSCQEMGIYTDKVKRAIDLRYLTYMNVLLKRLPDQAFSKTDKLRFVRDMEAKTELKNLCSEYPDEPLDELEYLYANGSEALLRHVQKKHLRRKLTRPIKRASYYVRIYTKEILIRLHIVKRQPKQKKG